MKGCNEAYCDAAIGALIAAASNLQQTTVREALRATPYGKGDTLGLDAIPEIEIMNQIRKFDPDSILITEELGRDVAREWRVTGDPTQQPVIFFCDPTDRSSELKRFLTAFVGKWGSRNVGELVKDRAALRVWNKIASTPRSITGATSAITCVRQGRVIFSVILNYITQELFLACSAGIYRYSFDKKSGLKPGKVRVADVMARGKTIEFPSLSDEVEDQWGAWKTYVTFLGKTGYKENFRDSMIFVEPGEDYLHYDRPGGPSRILYLSQIQPSKQPIGFILANGEKVGEWIHWLSFVRFAQTQGRRSLLLFEIFHERPWTKAGILMSTSPAYSIFQPEDDNYMLLDLSQLARFDNPSLFRSTLLVASASNQWVLHTMRQHQYRSIVLPPTTFI